MSLNKVQLIGRLGANPETRYTQSGTCVSNFSLATNEYYKGKDGQGAERTEWHKIVCFNKLGEIVRDNLEKGREIYLEGRLQTRQWKDRDGVTRYTTEVVAQLVRFLGSKPKKGNEAQADADPEDGNQFRQDVPPTE